ncbi:hypothetical protein ACVYAG_04490 [Acinetobacter baumannii]
MQITIVSAGKIIPASELISATLRTDLVPSYQIVFLMKKPNV